MTVLPDPTSDLDWGGFIGAIHDIFAANAQKFPDRTCVVETECSSSPRRTFSYKQINEASNVLAHHLVANGVERGDVVMIYAYRGVDLVVAVMGTLKAGGTFSVIDPLYPPERQKIYLEVAQPKALVNIEKATTEAGELSQLVREYIDGPLQLKAEVPALKIGDDGQLSGGKKDGVDVFDAVRGRASEGPGVVVGPDSNPTLSFTSGSEGRPKGVLGRHYSLAYYFPWMKERFELSENDKFTMLSGIAHDPIQRDIFTPLFLGAQLLVPAKEDIQHERLAEWMRSWEATVTHLTPAMGQILVGGASAQFPALRRAFFVGDILTKRDCNLLRNLAKNVNIINMYGTTETQRAVSYYEIPCSSKDPNFLHTMKDVAPAGRGMQNVQLLVVDRNDRNKQCSVGEVGEIYVRAAGLAEGYLGDPALNEKKFLSNWFIDPQGWTKVEKPRDEPWREFYKGPRDRLYRTGDLGRYLDSGDVECTGRADDQVKIRGFRIELGEINSHLGQHSLIRDCVTLVRRDKVEEPTLVSYIVPETHRWPKFVSDNGFKDLESDGSMRSMLAKYRPLQNELRSHLKRKLPAYAVPTHFIPLQKLPLNPNGKVDKPALPFPDVVELTAVASSDSIEKWKTLSDTEKTVATLWGKLIQGLNAQTIQRDDNFFDLGGHSMIAQQLLVELKRERGTEVPMKTLFQNPTLGAFASSIESIGDTTEEENYASDAETLAKSLPKSFPTAQALDQSKPLTAFITGATGFLGVYLLRDLLTRTNPPVNVIAHVRARSANDAIKRLRDECESHGIWEESWASRLECVIGELGESRLGLDSITYRRLLEDVDLVIHNGAKVHWVEPYARLRMTNVQGTLDALQLCSSGKAKNFVFVSSTSVLDSDFYLEQSEKGAESGRYAVPEADDLAGSRTGLSTGYGQSKWVGELLVREAGRRGLAGSIVRPGYILGDSRSGVTNTDDFLIRMLKGCIGLSSRPHITNTINMVPVDHVARVVVAAALHPPAAPLGVTHVTSHPRLTFDEFLSTLEIYGYETPLVDYPVWKNRLEEYIADGGVNKDDDQYALYPLYHFVTNNLPANTRAPELDDRNAVAALKADARWTGDTHFAFGSAVTREIVGRYLAYLTLTNYLKEPGNGMPLPKIELTDRQRAMGGIGGRGT